MTKRLLTGVVVLAVGMLVSQGAQAKTLEEILKEKGVITEADYKEVTKVKPFEYKLGKGVTFTSADEKFQFSLGGRMQFRYTFTDYDDGRTTGSGSTLASLGDSSQFNAQRIRLVAQGYAYTKDLTFKMEIDPRAYANNTRLGLLDSFVNYKVMDELQILVGQTKVKFGYSMIQADGALMFVDRAPFVTAMVPGYEIGAYVYGKAANGFVDYAMSVTNGDGQTAAASKNHNAFAARVGLSPLGAMANDEPDLAISKKPLFTVGANYLHNTVDDTTTNYATRAGLTTAKVTAGVNSEVNSFGVDGHFKWMGAALQGEAIFMEADPSDAAKIRALGYYVQAGYMITPKLGLAFRYSVLDPNRDNSSDLVTEQIGSVSYYFDKHNLKLQADVANIHDQNGANNTGTTDDLQFRAQVQLVF